MKRRLALKSEHLAELTPQDLAGVAGGYQELPTRRCFTGIYPSINWPCPTIDEPCFEIRQTPLCPTTV